MLTHAHQDHLGDLAVICDHFEVKILWIDREAASPQQQHLVALAAQRGTNVIHGLRGDHCELDGARADFLGRQIVPSEIGLSAKAISTWSFVPPKANEDSRFADDTDGAIRIFTNGKKLRVSRFVACTEIDATPIQRSRKRQIISRPASSNK